MRIRDCLVSVTEILVIREAIRTAIMRNMENIIVESDSQIAIGSTQAKL